MHVGARLTARQLEVAKLLHTTDKEIAAACGLSINTIKKRVKQVLKRTGSTTRTEAALKVAGVMG